MAMAIESKEEKYGLNQDAVIGNSIIHATTA
jgi:hypothetical protein